MMEKNKKKKLLLSKIAKEYQQFNEKVLLLCKEEVFTNAYRIDIIANIYQVVVRLADDMEDKEIEKLLAIDCILDFMYERWLKIEDDFYNQISDFVKCIVKKDKKTSEIS